MSEWVILLFLFISGSHCVPAWLPEQYGLRMEAAQLHSGRPWGEYTPGGLQALGLL